MSFRTETVYSAQAGTVTTGTTYKMRGFRKGVALTLSSTGTVATQVSGGDGNWVTLRTDTASAVFELTSPWPEFRWNISANGGTVTLRLSEWAEL